MASPDHLALLRQGVDAWIAWRAKERAEVSLSVGGNLNKLSRLNLRRADLSGANLPAVILSRADLHEANLSGADLHEADLSGADLRRANLSRADLSRAKLSGADLHGAELHGAALSGANLRWADLSAANRHTMILQGASRTGFYSRPDFSRTDFCGADLSEANLRRADLHEAYLSEANLSRADLSGANLSGACLREADLHEADLSGANFSGANLIGADLSRATLIETNLVDASLTDCRIYGISAWDVKLSKGTKQQDLLITNQGEAAVTVDNIEVAQFVRLLLHNEKIRDVLDTVGKKGVLLLGRFTEGRIAVLERLREELRQRGYLPIVFNFDKPETKDFTETVRLLAGLSKFVIADITNPKSAPLELQATVPEIMVPFRPIIEDGEKPFAMLQDLWIKHREWMFEPIHYSSVDALIASLDEKIIRPAEARFVELLARKAETMKGEHV
jgi:uncharacterized protein YjbI with pentapeptide repeats